MKKLIKILAVLVALGIVLLVIGSVALHMYLPPEKAKKLVLEKLSAQLKRDVEVGSVSVGLLSGLQMSDLKISESPNFSKGTFLSSEQFSIKVALLPLLYHKIVVRQILLNTPEVTIIRNADGKTFNFSDLTHDTTPSPPAAQSAGASSGTKDSLPFLLLVSRAEVQKGALHFVDRSPARQSVDIAPFDLKLKNVSLTTPFSVDTEMHIKSKGTELVVHFAGQANLFKGSFTIKQGSLTSRGTSIHLEGELDQLKSHAPRVDLKLDIPQLKLADLAPFLVLPTTVKIDQPIKASATVKGDEEKVDFNSQVSLGAVSVSGHGQVLHPTTTPSIAFHLETNAFPVKELLKYAPGSVPEGVTLDGNTHLSVDLSGTTADMHFAAKVDGTDLHAAKGQDFSKPAGMPLELSAIGDRTAAGKITLTTLTARLSSNQVVGSGTYEPRLKDAFVNFTAKATNWSVQDLAMVSPMLMGYHPTGTLSFDLHASGLASAPSTSLHTTAKMIMADIKQEFYEGKNLELNWNLSDITPDLARVSGTANFKQGPGKILNVEKLAASSRIGKILLAPVETLAKIQKKGVLQHVNLPSLQSIPFDSVVGDYLLKSGVVNIKTFNLNGQALSIQNQGTIGLAGVQPINLNVLMKLAAGSVGGTLGNILTDESGRPTIKFTATGTVSDPKVKLDVQEVGKKALQEAGKELLKNKDVQNAVNDLQNTFKGIFH